MIAVPESELMWRASHGYSTLQKVAPRQVDVWFRKGAYAY